MRPASRLPFTPGPTGGVEPPTVQELSQWLNSIDGPPGYIVETGGASPSGLRIVNVVYRNLVRCPVGILHMRLMAGIPEIVDIAVLPQYQRRGIAFKLAEHALAYGIDLRDAGTIWDGPLTPEGEAFRDKAVSMGRTRYGPATWESQ